MAITTYKFGVGETKSNKLASKRLETEIQNQADIVKKIVSINSNLGDNTFEVSFSDKLSAEEELLLVKVIGDHDGIDLKIQLPNLVRVLEEADEPSKRTGGHFRAKSFIHVSPIGEAESIGDFWLPYPASFLTMEFFAKPEQDGDRFTVDVMPETTIGFITEEAQIGTQTLTVNETAIQYATIGDVVLLANETHQEEVGYIIKIDKSKSQLTISGKVDESFTEFAPTVVKVSRRLCDNILLENNSGTVQIGGSKIGGAYVPPNTIFRTRYYNSDPLKEKRFHAILEFLY